jgi:hypothetical protein
MFTKLFWSRTFSALFLLGMVFGLAGSEGVLAKSLTADGTPPVPGEGAPIVLYPEKISLSRPLREITPVSPATKEIQAPVKEIPTLGLEKSISSPSLEVDSALQDWPGGVNIPTTHQNFEGVNNINGVLPPDTQGDVGPYHYVQWVNLAFAVYDKSGTLLYGPANGNTLWSGFGGICETHNDGDPITLYDHLSDRWLMSQFGLSFPNNFHQCIAISQTGDPLGAWYLYDYQVHTVKMNDYPKFGVWPDAYYMTANQFHGSTYGWEGAGVWAFERDKMLSGLPAQLVYFDLASVNIDFGGMLPADLDGPPPPAGTPGLFAEVDDGSWIPPNDAMRIWEFHVDWANPTNSTFGLAGQPNQTLPTIPFNQLPCTISGSSNCIPQPGTSQKIDAIGDRLMYRLAYRNYGSYQAMVVNHSVLADSGDRAGVRWYELREDGSGWYINQEGTYAPADGLYRWMGSIAMDAAGNIGLGYSASSSSYYPSVHYTGRLVTDPPGSMPQGEGVIITGSGSQTHYAARWGDYSMMGIDPVDDCTFWFTSEYLSTTGDAPWRTRVGSFKFVTCGSLTGTLEGTVTDNSTGDPIVNAVIEAGGYSSTTDNTGFYQLTLPVGVYDITATAYGHADETVTGINIDEGITTLHNFSLTALPSITASGYVFDYNGRWPLYASIEIDSYPDGPIFTDPATGFYSVELLQGMTYSFTANAIAGSYIPRTRIVIPTPGVTANFTLRVDELVCEAPGYAPSLSGVFEQFEYSSTPPGWMVVDNQGNSQIWAFDDPGGRGNLTGGSGGFAIADSDFYGSSGSQDTELRSPVMDFTALPNVTISFDTDFYTYNGADTADVDVSIDGGSSWTNVWRQIGDYRGPAHVVRDITSLAAGNANVVVRFHYYNASYEWWWQVDNVLIGDPACNRIGDGLVVGNVYDDNTAAPLVGALIEDDLGNTARSFTTPEDPALEDGFYVLSSTAARHILFGSANGYGDLKHRISVRSRRAVTQDFAMPAGLLSHFPTSLTMRLLAGEISARKLILTNNGGTLANFEVLEINTPPVTIDPGLVADIARRVGPKHLNDMDSRSVYQHLVPDVPPLAAGDVYQTWPTGLASAWGAGFNLSVADLWLGDVGAGGGTDLDYRFLTNGTNTSDTIDVSSWIGSWAGDMTYNPYTGMLWQVNVGGDNCLYELDPVSLTSTGSNLCPGFGTSQRGVTFDPITNSYFVGSWTEGTIYRVDETGILESANVGLDIAGLAYNPATRHLFVLANSAAPAFDVYVLDVSAGYANLGGFDIPGLLDYAQAGLEIDCNGHLWAVDQTNQTIFEVDSGETGICSWQDIPWLSADPTSGRVGPDGRTTMIRFTFDATALGPGTYQAQIQVHNDTPYGPVVVPVTLRVK